MSYRRGDAKPGEAVIAEVGGLVDESRVTLGVYGENLEPEEITARLGVAPTTCRRKGDRKGPRSPPATGGNWLLTVEAEGSEGPNEITVRLLDSLPDDVDVWRRLSETYTVRLLYGIHFTGWNRGFELEPQTLARIARLGSEVGFDLYAYEEDD